MMHHLPEELKRQGLAEIARVLKSGGRLLIVDLKRPTGWLSRVIMALMLHGGLQHGVQDLPAMLGTADFMCIEAGDTGFKTLGFVRGQKAHAVTC
jgi:SAM-dependent methyltransferase